MTILPDDYEIIDQYEPFHFRAWKEFMGRGIRDAERAHTGRGIWDVVLEGCSNEEVAQILGEAAVTDPAAHFHLSRTSIIVEKSTGLPIASTSGFHYPTCRVKNSQRSITNAWIKLFPETFPYPTTEVESMKIWERIDFLDDSFPDWDYDNTWMLDTVYVDPAHRGKKLAEVLVNHVLTKGKQAGHTRSLITCAVGNERARKVYERTGYKLIGQGENPACLTALGSSGFYVLEKYLQ